MISYQLILIYKNMQDTNRKTIIDVDLNSKENDMGRFFSFLKHPIFISVVIILISAGALLFAITLTKNELPQASAKEAAIGQLNNPKVVIEAYEDFMCPACRAFNPVQEQLIEKYKDKSVKFVFKHFPLPSHKYAKEAAEASEYANDEGKFWEYKNKLYNEQQKVSGSGDDDKSDTLKRENLIKFAEEIGLNGTEMTKRIEGRMYKTRVQSLKDEGEKKGVDGTPSIFINGEKLPKEISYTDYEGIANLIDEKLNK